MQVPSPRDDLRPQLARLRQYLPQSSFCHALLLPRSYAPTPLFLHSSPNSPNLAAAPRTKQPNAASYEMPLVAPQTQSQPFTSAPRGQEEPSIRSARLTSRLDLWYSSSRNGLNSEGTQRLKAAAGLAKAIVFSLSPPRYFPVTHVVAQHRRGGQFSPLRGIAGSSACLRRTSAPSLGVP